MRNNNFKPRFTTKNNSFTPKFSTKGKPRRVDVNVDEQDFSSKFSQENWDSKITVGPEVETAEEVYYDEIVLYDGGGAEGYGYD